MHDHPLTFSTAHRIYMHKTAFQEMAANETVAAMPSGFPSEVFQPPLHVLIAIFNFVLMSPANLLKPLSAVPGFVLKVLTSLPAAVS